MGVQSFCCRLAFGPRQAGQATPESQCGNILVSKQHQLSYEKICAVSMTENTLIQFMVFALCFKCFSVFVSGSSRKRFELFGEPPRTHGLLFHRMKFWHAGIATTQLPIEAQHWAARLGGGLIRFCCRVRASLCRAEPMSKNAVVLRSRSSNSRVCSSVTFAALPQRPPVRAE